MPAVQTKAVLTSCAVPVAGPVDVSSVLTFLLVMGCPLATFAHALKTSDRRCARIATHPRDTE